ncbi:hypothetical protein Rhsp01_61850 [Rhizobium sp. NBRC 114257]|uniref:Uncharacterized protein n=1 Tax=Rhizobium dioscoreae TaxID=2653122 RepID=A0ABQ0ZDD5_9HYPH|nr:hypothetical protein RsS93_61370 [Rhizobium dioscoreae]GLU85009.1 hypothetical protein Rhsp01_61850 [Rhizobium sp. NBRC 114257]
MIVENGVAAWIDSIAAYPLLAKACKHDQTGASSSDQSTGHDVDHHNDGRHRREGKSRLEGRPALHDLKEQAEDEDQSVEGEVDNSADPYRRGEGPASK